MKSGGGSSGHVGVYVGQDWWTHLSTYEDHTPILDISCGSMTVAISVTDRQVTGPALEFARELAAQATKFAAEVERLHAGRRVLVSRKWSGKTLADHRADRKAWLTGMLGLPATDPGRYRWEPVRPGDLDHMPRGQRLLHVVADRIQWQTALDQARRRATEADPPARGRAA